MKLFGKCLASAGSTFIVLMLLGGVAPGGPPLSTLSDEFDDSATLGNWQRIYQVEGWNANQLETWDIDTTQAGRMVMIPYSSSWFEDYRGNFAFKTVTGDFVATAEIFIDDRDGGDGNMIPESDYSLGGVLVRAPRAITDPTAEWSLGGENYTFLSMGNGNTSGAGLSFQFEDKTTVDSNSTLILTNTTTDNAVIQLARIGGDVIVLRQSPGQSWVVHRRFDRDDFPATLQVGAFSYTDWPTVSGLPVFQNNISVTTGPGTNADIVAGFEYFRFEEPVVPPALVGQDLGPSGGVSDAQLLSFLGDNANPAPSRVGGWQLY